MEWRYIWLLHSIGTVCWVSIALSVLYKQGVHRLGARGIVLEAAKRLKSRFCAPLRWRALLWVALISSVGLSLATLFGVATSFLKPRFTHFDLFFKSLPVFFIMPGVIEEAGFRGLLIRMREDEFMVLDDSNVEARTVSTAPATTLGAIEDSVCPGPEELAAEAPAAAMPELRPTAKRPPRLEQVANVAAFVIYHVDLIHMAPPLFRDWRFLTVVGMGGFCFQEALLRSGSLWPPIIMHWIVVAALFNFGGIDQSLMW